MGIKKQSGFTIVELLIVIVIIGILAALVTSSFVNAQGSARDARRLNDMAAINRAIKAYIADTGTAPPLQASGLGTQDGYEVSGREAVGEFLAPLKNYGFPQGVPVDPTNDAIDNLKTNDRTGKKKGYYYYVYNAGNNGCDAARGKHYVLGFLTADSGADPHPASPGFSCPGRTWQTGFSWVAGGFEN